MRLSTRAFVPVFVTFFCAVPASRATAQSTERRFEVAAHVAVARSGEFDATETGVGGRFAWLPFARFGLEAEVTLYPSDYPDRVAFSSARWEALFGGTFGPWIGRVRPFAAVRSGFVTYREAPEPLACIAIFPPPLACTLASGRSVPALGFGGGVDVAVGDRSFIRLDLSDRLLRYEGPVFDSERAVRDGDFWTHGFRFAVGAGLSF